MKFKIGDEIEHLGTRKRYKVIHSMHSSYDLVCDSGRYYACDHTHIDNTHELVQTKINKDWLAEQQNFNWRRGIIGVDYAKPIQKRKGFMAKNEGLATYDFDSKCQHKYVQYTGFSESYKYYIHCDEKENV